MRGNNAPDLGVRYPFRIGKSLKSPTASRNILALKFMHIPEKAALSAPGTLSRVADDCLVQLPTLDGNSSVHFSGTRRTQPDSSVHDYVLVCVDGKIWLERTADYFYSIRPLDPAKTTRPPPQYPANPHEDDGPDSWHLASGSPITPEDDMPIEPDIPPVPPPRTAGKSTPPMASRPTRGKFITAGRLNSLKPAVAASPPTAAKSVATKSIAGKGLSNANGAVGRRRPADDDDDDDDDNGSNASSSEEDDSDDSDSDSDSDSADYTDRSSDEE